MTSETIRRVYLAIAVLFGGSALVLQFGVSASAGTLGSYVSSFTILANFFAVAVMTAAFFRYRSEDGAAFAGPAVVYLVVVAATYFAELHGRLEATRGVAVYIDATIHYGTPLLFIIYWLAFVTRGGLNWLTPVTLLIFPLVYLGYTLGRGVVTGLYPYPFLDAAAFGYAKVAVNALGLLLVYFGLGVVLTGIDRVWATLCPPVDLSIRRA